MIVVNILFIDKNRIYFFIKKYNLNIEILCIKRVGVEIICKKMSMNLGSCFDEKS